MARFAGAVAGGALFGVLAGVAAFLIHERNETINGF